MATPIASRDEVARGALEGAGSKRAIVILMGEPARCQFKLLRVRKACGTQMLI